MEVFEDDFVSVPLPAPSETEILAYKKILAALELIEREVGLPIDADVAAVPSTFERWEPDISLLLNLWSHRRPDLAKST